MASHRIEEPSLSDFGHIPYAVPHMIHPPTGTFMYFFTFQNIFSSLYSTYSKSLCLFQNLIYKVDTGFNFFGFSLEIFKKDLLLILESWRRLLCCKQLMIQNNVCCLLSLFWRLGAWVGWGEGAFLFAIQKSYMSRTLEWPLVSNKCCKNKQKKVIRFLFYYFFPLFMMPVNNCLNFLLILLLILKDFAFVQLYTQADLQQLWKCSLLGIIPQEYFSLIISLQFLQVFWSFYFIIRRGNK